MASIVGHTEHMPCDHVLNHVIVFGRGAGAMFVRMRQSYSLVFLSVKPKVELDSLQAAVQK